ncbi:MAG: phosphoribosylformylglycinamidine synthase subunit PurL, partial [Thermoleophilia bacterium]|nr:phosphoribosylformylglycinamidine synthase subunit PurL [Thermoleophilia bacterium]
VESHNHPSAVEPYQGAATGVGGILRDVFTMGARPVAILDALRFGPITQGAERATESRRLLAGVVAGIAGYGNCVGVPTVGGEVEFDPAYARNPLVNAMCIGLMRHDELQLGAATGTGNPVLYVGARTGRDGIHGATFASVDDPHAHERSAVQVGDPFREKLLIEACLELYASGIVVGVQDMGAAGLTSSAVEMAARAGSGIELDLDRVPRREPGMAPWELMLSESQERMLVVVRAGTEREARAIFDRWDLDCVQVGAVTDTGTLTLREAGEVVCRLPLSMLVDDTPEYRWPSEPQPVQRLDDDQLATITDLDAATAAGALLDLLARPTIASKRWIHDQFDSMVGAATAVRPGSDAAVLRVRGTDRALAASIDCCGRWCARDPYAGAMHAVAEATRNVACSGARPLAITDCLNFSNPELPHVAWQLEQAIAGMGDACRALDTPVTGGNVSLYNRTDGIDIHPTPVVGAVGVLDDAERATTIAWQPDHELLLVGPAGAVALDATEYLASLDTALAGGAPPIDLEVEARVQRLLVAAIGSGLVASAHDCSDGGVAVTLAESAIAGGVGASIDVAPLVEATGRVDAALFGEGASRVVVQVAAAQRDAFEQLARAHDVQVTALGTAAGTSLVIRAGTDVLIDEPLAALAAAHAGTLPRLMEGIQHA